MKHLLGVMMLVGVAVGQLFGPLERDYRVNSIDSVGPITGGCRKKHSDNRSLPGGAEACASHKPLKVKGMEKISKRLCADGYEYCSSSHKSLHRISWKPESMPKSCFAFHYKKGKFAGYGHNCHRNLYFDGLLCCPSNAHETKHHLQLTKNKLFYEDRPKFNTADKKLY